MTKSLVDKVKNVLCSRTVSRMTFGMSDKLYRLNFDETEYWEERYIKGGNSGVGSYGELAQYKSSVINAFIQDNDIQSVLEFGCGDGNQLSLYNLPYYIGFDVSSKAISLCKDTFRDDKTKAFKKYDGNTFELGVDKADLVLSVDVIYHITNEIRYESYLNALFNYSRKYVLIYSTNFNKKYKYLHQINRKFSSYIDDNIPEFSLIKVFDNPFKGEDTMSDFYLYQRV